MHFLLAHACNSLSLRLVREREGERKKGREREGERKKERKKERERDVEYGCFIFKVMMGALAPFSYLVKNS